MNEKKSVTKPCLGDESAAFSCGMLMSCSAWGACLFTARKYGEIK